MMKDFTDRELYARQLAGGDDFSAVVAERDRRKAAARLDRRARGDAEGTGPSGLSAGEFDRVMAISRAAWHMPG